MMVGRVKAVSRESAEMEVSGMISQSLYCFPSQVGRTGSQGAFLCVSCGDFVGRASEFCLSTLGIRPSFLELGQGASGIDLMGFPSLLMILLRKVESGQSQTLRGGGGQQHPLRSQLCH